MMPGRSLDGQSTRRQGQYLLQPAVKCMQNATAAQTGTEAADLMLACMCDLPAWLPHYVAGCSTGLAPQSGHGWAVWDRCSRW